MDATKEKQLKLWRQLIVDFCMHQNVFTLTVANFYYFQNDSINRRLSPEGREAVINYLINSGLECIQQDLRGPYFILNI